MLCLGIESTAHTFSCSVINSGNNNDNNDDIVLSEVRDIYKAPAGWGIHPRDASKHHAQVAPKILKECLDNAHVRYKKYRSYFLFCWTWFGTMFANWSGNS